MLPLFRAVPKFCSTNILFTYIILIFFTTFVNISIGSHGSTGCFGNQLRNSQGDLIRVHVFL